MRIPTATLAFVLVLGACSGKAPPASYGDPSAIPSGDATASGRASSTATPSGGGSNEPGTTPTQRSSTSAPEPVRYGDDLGVGQMARAYLRDEPATTLVVEIDYVEDRAPRPATLDHLDQILEQVTDKPGGVVVRRDDPIPEERGTYGQGDILRLESRYRDQRSKGSTAVLYLLFLNGNLKGVESALGVAYKASAAAIFADGIDSAATALVQAAAIERSVVTHEAGHLLGLVNLVQPSAYNHEDPDHPKHSRYEESVMYWAIEDISIAALLSGGPPDTFDRYDLADLKALRTG